MKNYILFLALVAGLLAVVPRVNADDANDAVIKEVMKTCNKAPKGTDTLGKKVIEQKATPEEIAKLVAEYKKLMSTTPPKGDAADWKKKTTRIYEAAKKLQSDPSAVADFKEAVNCKACHSLHKPQ